MQLSETHGAGRVKKEWIDLIGWATLLLIQKNKRQER